MYEVILLLLVYIIAISCIAIMNKISPGNRMYTAWVAFVCVALTACESCRAQGRSKEHAGSIENTTGKPGDESRKRQANMQYKHSIYRR